VLQFSLSLHANLWQLVESVISDLSVDHRESFHVVRLNGFIHTDDKLALKEIWRQLGREMEVEDDLTGKANLPFAPEF
jgi:origin recognition complex subunit 4